MKLITIEKKHYRFLYDLLKERDTDINISHKEIPSWEDHIKFIESTPYTVWLIITDIHLIGNIYLTKNDEIGIFIKKEYQKKGYAYNSIRKLIQLYPRDRYLANINPLNSKSISLFNKIGFKHIQNTYEFLIPTIGEGNKHPP